MCWLNPHLNINNSNLPVRCLNFGMSPCLSSKRVASLWRGPWFSISLGWITYISSVTDEAWIHSVNSVHTWFILIVTLGLAVAPLQNGSLHEKIKAEALIWNLFVNSGLWDEDTSSACKCYPAEAWTSPTLTVTWVRHSWPDVLCYWAHSEGTGVKLWQDVRFT